MRGIAVALGILLAAVLAVALALAPRFAALEDSAPEVVFRVERGASLARVAADLERAGLVRDARAVEWLALHLSELREVDHGHRRQARTGTGLGWSLQALPDERLDVVLDDPAFAA